MERHPSFLRTAIAWVVGAIATVGLTLPAMVMVLAPGLRLTVFRMAKLWGRICVWATGCKVTTDGLEDIDLDGRYVVVVNHQSALDIPVLMSVLPAEWRTVFWAKKSLFKIPILGSAMRTLGHMPVDRIDRRTAGQTLVQSQRRTESERSLLVFPEETYAPEGESLPFQRGGFLFALKTGMPVLPVGVWGTRTALPPNGRLVAPTSLRVCFGAPIPTTDLPVSARAELTDHARRVIEALSQPPAAV